MGIYIFEADVLYRALEADAALQTNHDFGKDILPAMIKDSPVFAYRFHDENKKAAKHWRDIGTLDAYYEANMDLVHVNPEFNLYDPEWVMRTISRRRRPRSSCSPTSDNDAERRRTRSSRRAASSADRRSAAACSARTSACTASAPSKTPS